MPDVVEPASSSRASCRGCGRKIAKGKLRFGESLANPFGEGEATYWFHLTCAACMRPEKLLLSLSESQHDISERAWLERTAEAGQAHERLPRLAHAERASSGRARCRSCHELIEKGSWRLSLQMFEEGRMMPIGFIHLACAEPYFGTSNILDRIEKLSSDLSLGDVADIAKMLKEPPAARREPGEAPRAGPDARTEPHPTTLAKTRPTTDSTDDAKRLAKAKG